VQFCLPKHRSYTWDPKVLFSELSGRSEEYSLENCSTVVVGSTSDQFGESTNSIAYIYLTESLFSLAYTKI
jgi:hypothetical protein